ncbi:MAG: hypothetical protein GQ540_03250 [Lutibacter sp.]|uniref:hypothetical protein n=1 Tax=Lutibacter sp. TaxID=1925666 RepID=UPI0019F98F50|nr:hypothetical protein [Lutibacter sp.]NOR27528.1 hypothetical protein [Lutibacter sp.]
MYKRENIGEIVTDKNGVKVKIVDQDNECENWGCDGCFYDSIPDVGGDMQCNPIRDDNGKIGCSDGDFIFQEVIL